MSVGGYQRVTPSHPAELTVEQVVRSRISAVEQFLDTRGLNLAKVEETVGRTVDGHPLVLLTSSPVHGLANHLSDIDTVCIFEHEGAIDARMATQIFDSGNHLESICFSRTSVARDLDRLADVARMTPGQAVAEHSAWNATRTVKLKYLERIVNGVATNRTMPYVDHMQVLGTVWQRSSFERAVRLALYGVLAERAGERRARLGYATNATLFAMDALLSHHGEVYSNRKWFLLRWARFRRLAALDDAPIRAIEEVCRALPQSPSEPKSLSLPLVHMIRQLGVTLGVPVAEVALRLADGACQEPLLPGGSLLFDPDAGAVPAQASDIPDGEFKVLLEDLDELDPDKAAVLLRASRANVLKVVVWP